MNLAKLSRQLRREVLRSPKKASILGVLFLVAMYFWVPLVWEFVPGNQDASTQAGEPASNEADTAALGHFGTAGPTTPTREPDVQAPTYDWTQLDQWITQDPVTAAAGDLPNQRDPFRAIMPEVAEVAVDEEPEAAAEELTLEDLGVELTSTVVGPQRSVALINGRAYKQGDVIELASNGRLIEMILAEVHPRSAILLWRDKRFELSIPQSTYSNLIN